MDIVAEKIGAEGEVKISLEQGKIMLKLMHKHASGQVEVSVEEDAKYFLEKLKAVIPGSIDDFLIDAAKAALP